MDELNKRIIELMVRLELTKSSFAKALDISLPLITHITTGRNKPGLDIIQKILVNFKQISPEWLLLGNGSMYIETPKKQDFTEINMRIVRLSATLDRIETTHQTVIDYHKLLSDEIMHLNELSEMIKNSSHELSGMKAELQLITSEININ